MKKNRIVMLFMSLAAITPALLGSAGAVEHRSASAEIYQDGNRDTRECNVRNKTIKSKNVAAAAAPAGKGEKAVILR